MKKLNSAFKIRKALKHGLNNVSLNENTTMRINIVGSNSFNFYNVMRIIQTIIGLIMILIGGSTYIQLRNAKILNKINGVSINYFSVNC